ncbi:flagellar protein FliO/FliZ [Lachnospiraceae bacterium XBB1006]|nr:flagellar protein FliO/FliZ [Lachnospiraceae bacterium XBB1006]
MYTIIGSSGLDNVVQLLVVLVIFVFVLVITILTTRFIGGYQKMQMNNRNIRMIESLRLSNNKYIGLLEVGEVFLVVGVGKDEITPIAKLTKEELPDLKEYESVSSPNMKEGFQDILDKVKRKKTK